MSVLEIRLLGHPPSPNATRRQHWGQRSGEASRWRELAKFTALQAIRDNGTGDDYPLTEAHLEIIWLVRDNRRRDPDNVIAACKPLLDGIVDARVIPDDSFTVIKSLGVRSERDKWDGVAIRVWR